MAITQVGATTTTGDSASATSRAPAVPTGAAAGDMAYVFLDVWEAIDPAINVPSGFVQILKLSGGSGGKSYCFQKRLTAADVGTYSFSWSGSMWATAHCTMLRGVKASGDPVGSNYATALAISSTFPSVSVSPSYAPGAQPALLWHGYNDSAGSHAAPTGFAKTAEVDCAVDAILLPTSGSSWTASGATVSASSAIKALLIAVEPEAGGGDPNEGSGSGAWTFAGSASGHAPALDPNAGTASGTYAYTGSATGRREAAGQAAGAHTWTGAATGRRDPSGTAAGIWSYAGTAAGTRPSSGTATGSLTYAGTATGHAPDIDQPTGTATGATSWTGAATGARPSAGTAAGTLTWTGTAVGHSGITPYTPAPPARTRTVSAEPRTRVVASQDRTYRIGAS